MIRRESGGIESVYGCAMRPITAADLMNPEVLTVQDDWTVAELARFLLANEITGAPVESSQDGGLVGVVSLRDLVACMVGEEDEDYPDYDDQSWTEGDEALNGDDDEEDDDDEEEDDDELYSLEELSLEDVDLDDDSDLGPLLVEDVMTPEVYAVGEDASVTEVAGLMLQHHLHRVMVLDEAGEAVGIISTSDLLGLLVEEG